MQELCKKLLYLKKKPFLVFFLILIFISSVVLGVITSNSDALYCSLFGCTMQGDIDMGEHSIINAIWVNATKTNVTINYTQLSDEHWVNDTGEPSLTGTFKNTGDTLILYFDNGNAIFYNLTATGTISGGTITATSLLVENAPVACSDEYNMIFTDMNSSVCRYDYWLDDKQDYDNSSVSNSTYLKQDGTTPLTGNWNYGNNNVNGSGNFTTTGTGNKMGGLNITDGTNSMYINGTHTCYNRNCSVYTYFNGSILITKVN